MTFRSRWDTPSFPCENFRRLVKVYLQWLIETFGKLLLPIDSDGWVVLTLQLFLNILSMLIVLLYKLIHRVLLIIVCNVPIVAHAPSLRGVEIIVLFLSIWFNFYISETWFKITFGGLIYKWQRALCLFIVVKLLWSHVSFQREVLRNRVNVFKEEPLLLVYAIAHSSVWQILGDSLLVEGHFVLIVFRPNGAVRFQRSAHCVLFYMT